MKTLILLSTLLLVTFGSATKVAAQSINGRIATDQLLRALGRDVLFGATPDGRPCVVDVVQPNSFHSDTVVRAYVGTKIDDVPQEAAWIRLEPSHTVRVSAGYSSLKVQSVEIHPDEEGFTKISSEATVSAYSAIEKRSVTIKTHSSYVHNFDGQTKGSRRLTQMTCLVD